MKAFIYCLLILTVVESSTYGQIVRSRGPFIINLDYARFRNDSSSTYLEVYSSFYSGSIALTPVDSGFKGVVMMTTVIRTKDTDDTLVLQRRRMPISVPDTSAISRRSVYIVQSGFALPNNEYVLEVFASDSLDSSKKDSIQLPIMLTRYAQGVTGSDIELCTNIGNATGKHTTFTKNSLEVVPNPSVVFGATTYPVLFRYTELYNLDTATTYVVTAQVLDPTTNKAMRVEQKRKKYSSQNSVEAGLSNVGSIRSGRYYYRVTLSDTLGHDYFQTEKRFYLDNPHIKQAQLPASSVKAAELAGMTAEDLADEFRRAKYLATDAEIKTFAAITTADGRREFLAKFWTEIEGDRPPLHGVQRAEYLHRVEAANQRYRSSSREGWRSDRGRVFVLNGDPDEIERFPSSGDVKPYEIWHYYKIENGVEFDFVDRSGFGDYILVNSTKRGEIQDDQWQRYLH